MPAKPVRKNRTAMSCERCKSRKTKCNNPIPGPCDYCRSTKATCHVDTVKRRQRPYYSVSHEEYRHMVTILRHYLPEADLDLSTLRTLASRCQEARDLEDTSTPVCHPTPDSPVERSPAQTQSEELSAVSIDGDIVLEEVVKMQRDLGCLLVDARGQHRYVGAESGISFNSAVRGLTTNPTPVAERSNIIPGLEMIKMPVPDSPSVLGSPSKEKTLPPNDSFLQCALRFFEQVHCIYWLYPSEQFYSRLHLTYSNPIQERNDSWMCSLFCIFALGSVELSGSDEVHRSGATECLDMAKLLVSSVCDEATIDSVRAMILLSLAMQSYAFSNSAYLYAGIAVRIAFSLGLHMDKYFSSNDMVQRETGRRIWWTLHTVDQEMAFRVGKPCMAGPPVGTRWNSPLPSEHILNTGPNTPPGFLELSVSLAHLYKIARNSLYVESAPLGPKPSINNIKAVLTSLHDWASGVPDHLSPTAPVAPLHRRPITFLHVRYWSAIILVARPFLLCNLLRRSQLVSTPQLAVVEELSTVCLDAADQALRILERMEQGRLLSTILVADFYHVLDLIQIFLIAYALGQTEKSLSSIRRCLTIMQDMKTSGYCQKMLPEVLNQLANWGILDESGDVNVQPPDTSLLHSQLGDNFFEEFFNSAEASSFSYADTFFAGMDFFSSEGQGTQLVISTSRV